MGVATAAVGRVRARTLAEPQLFRLTLGFIALTQVGAHVDAWYHLRYGFAIESFFTWPHALLYAGEAGTGAVVALYLLESLALRRPRQAWLPAGYPLVLLGTVLFLAGGAFDLAWHALFGFEVSVEALLSPAHLWLLAAFTIGAAGVLRAGFARRAREAAGAARPLVADLPVLLGFAILLRAALWSLFYSEPGAADYAAQGALHRDLFGFAGVTWEGMTAQVAGTTGILLHTVVLTLFLVVPLRWLRPAGGAIAAIMLWSGLLVAAATDSLLYLPAVAAGALAGEAVWARVRRGGWGGPDGEAGYWALAAAVPLAQFAAYFALMAAVGGGVAWPPSLVAGAPLMAAFYGLVAGLLAVPPRFVRAALGP